MKREEHVQRARKRETPRWVQREHRCKGRGRDGVVHFTGGQDWIIKKLVESIEEGDYHVRGFGATEDL